MNYGASLAQLCRATNVRIILITAAETKRLIEALDIVAESFSRRSIEMFT